MEKQYRVMASDENGSEYYNKLFADYEKAKKEYEELVEIDTIAKEVLLDEVFFDSNDEWVENKDNSLLVWQDNLVTDKT